MWSEEISNVDNWYRRVIVLVGECRFGVETWSYKVLFEWSELVQGTHLKEVKKKVCLSSLYFLGVDRSPCDTLNYFWRNLKWFSIHTNKSASNPTGFLRFNGFCYPKDWSNSFELNTSPSVNQNSYAQHSTNTCNRLSTVSCTVNFTCVLHRVCSILLFLPPLS